MNLSFLISEAGLIEGTSLTFIKGCLKAGSLMDRFIGTARLDSRDVEIEILGKTLLPITTDPLLKTYVLKVKPPRDVSLSELVGKTLSTKFQAPDVSPPPDLPPSAPRG